MVLMAFLEVVSVLTLFNLLVLKLKDLLIQKFGLFLPLSWLRNLYEKLCC